MKELKNKIDPLKESTDITREEALKKFGKYAAVTALGTFLLLNPQKAQASSTPPPGDGFRRRGF